MHFLITKNRSQSSIVVASSFSNDESRIIYPKTEVEIPAASNTNLGNLDNGEPLNNFQIDLGPIEYIKEV